MIFSHSLFPISKIDPSLHSRHISYFSVEFSMPIGSIIALLYFATAFPRMLPTYHITPPASLLLHYLSHIMQPEAPEGMRYQTDPAYISFIDLSLTCLYEVRSELDAVIRWREDNKDPTAPSPPAEPTLDRVGPSADPSPPSDSTFNGVGPSTGSSHVQLPPSFVDVNLRSRCI